MTRRERLFEIVRDFRVNQACDTADRVDAVTMSKNLKAIQHLERKIPKVTVRAPRISSQKKLEL